MRWTEGHLAASQRPWRRRPRRGRSAWHACGWVSREPGRPRRLHRKARRGAGTGSPSPRPRTEHLPSTGAKPQVLGWYRRAKATKRGGMGGEESACLIVPPKRGELSPRDPVEGRGHRQVAPVEGKTANTPRLGPVSTSRQRIAELARQALAARGESPAAFGGRGILSGGVAPRSNMPNILPRRALPARRLAHLGATRDFHHGLLGMAVAIAWLPGPAGTRRRVAKLSVEEPDAAEPARPDLWGARVSNDPGLPDRTKPPPTRVSRSISGPTGRV